MSISVNSTAISYPLSDSVAATATSNLSVKEQTKNEAVVNTIDAQAKNVFDKLKITEWYLPITAGEPSVGTLSIRQPKPVFDKQTHNEISKIQEMINNSIANPDIPLPNLILKGKAGVGKTMLLEELCRASDIGFIRIPSGTMENHLRCATHITALHDIFKIANLCSQQVYIIMDDGEELVATRSAETKKVAVKNEELAPWLKAQEEIGETIAQRRVALVNAILEESGKDFRKVAFAITTNRDKVIDGAFRTRSTVLKISSPDLQERIRIIATHLPRVFNNDMRYLGFFHQGRLEDMGFKTEGFTGRNIVNMLKNLRACVQMEEKNNADQSELMRGLTQEIINASIYTMRHSLEKENQLQTKPRKRILGVKLSALKPQKLWTLVKSFAKRR